MQAVGQVYGGRCPELRLDAPFPGVGPPKQPIRAPAVCSAGRSRRVPQRDRLPPPSRRPPELPAGAGRERGPEALRHPRGCGGWGPRLCGSPAVGEGRQDWGAALPMRMGFAGDGVVGRLGSALRPLSPSWDPGSPCLNPVEHRVLDSFLRCRSFGVCERRGLSTQPPGWAEIPEEQETNPPWREDGKGLRSPHSLVHSSNGDPCVRGAMRRFCRAIISP